MFQDTSTTVWEFTLQSLKDITNNFCEEHMIGSGAYGSVYKGRLLDNGEEIAMKKLHYNPGLKGNEFENEFNNLMMVRHQNIVRLVGYCYHEEHQPFFLNGKHIFALVEEKILCFEYLEGGSLDKHISDESSGLDWPTRYKIITGICDGVNYLHNGTKDPMYHLDLKPENILLDKTMIPKIADFGLSRLLGSTQTCITNASLGTRGYMPPEYINRNEITPKFDVFSLGVIIIRIIAGNGGYPKCADMPSQEFINLVHGNWEKRLHPTMPSHTSQEIKTCIEIALRCVEIERVKRPMIAEIIDELKKIGASFATVQSSQELGNFPVFKKVPYTTKRSPKNKVTDFRPKQAINKQYTSSDDSDVQFGTVRFNDDEPIIAPLNPGTRPTPIEPERVQLVIKNNNEVPSYENNEKVMLELTGGDSIGDRPGLDLVAVLDVSGSMRGEKMEMMMTAMHFVIHKLSPIDRLSVVTFSRAATRLFTLRQTNLITTQRELKGLINGLMARGSTNIRDGLQTGLKVLADRKVSSGRVVGIMLMSDGEQTSGDASEVDVSNVPVYTFGFGLDYDPTVLHSIADKSMGGTFSVVEDIGRLTMAFSQCLAGLVTVVVQDLKLTMACVQDESKIQKVTSGSYPQTQDSDPGSVTVSLGDLYSGEVRKVIVDLLLPAIQNERDADILEITYSYSISGKLFNAPPVILAVWRIGMAVSEEKPAELQIEETHVQTAEMISEARDMADCKQLSNARDKLVEAQSMLEGVSFEQSNSNSLLLLLLLRTELQDLLKLMESQGTYDRQGRSYALSSELSHGRQRFAARGDMEILRLFATPRMDKYLVQAKMFHQDPTRLLPSADDDAKEEIAGRINLSYRRNEEELLRLRLDMEE